MHEFAYRMLSSSLLFTVNVLFALRRLATPNETPCNTHANCFQQYVILTGKRKLPYNRTNFESHKILCLFGIGDHFPSFVCLFLTHSRLHSNQVG